MTQSSFHHYGLQESLLSSCAISGTVHSYELAHDDPQATSGVLFRQCALLDGHRHRGSLVKCPEVVVLLALTFHRQQFRGSVRVSSQCSLQFVFNRIKDFSGKDVGLRLQ